MQRSRRISRPLFVALAVVVSIGLCFYAVKVNHARALALHAADVHSSPVTATPAIAFTAPQTQPAGVLLAAVTIEPAPLVAPAEAPITPLVTRTPPINPPLNATPVATPPLNTTAIAPPLLSATAIAQAEPTTRPAALLATDQTNRHNITPVAPVAAITAPTTAPVISGNVMIDAKQKREIGDLVAAREELNNALLAGHLSETEADAVRHNMAEINQTLVFSPQRTLNDPWAAGYPVQSGERLSTIANKNSVTWQLLSRINHIDPKRLRSGSTIKTVKGPFFAVVSKSKFRMDIYFGAPGGPGSMYVTSFAVGLGKNDSTPTGTWQVQSGNKVLHPRYYSPNNAGVIDADDPKNPLGGYWIGLEGLDGQAVDQHSYGIHGTIEPDSIGKQASLGCIRMGRDEIALTFELLVETKSKIVIVP